MPRPTSTNFTPPILAFLGVGLAAGFASCGPRGEPPALLSTQPAARDAVSTNQSAVARPSPSPSPDARLSALDREIAELQTAIEAQSPFMMNDLDERIAGAQAMIASLNLETELERATQSDRLRILQSQQQVEDARIRDRLAAMANRVRMEENEFTMGQNQFSMLVAPEESDLIRRGRAGLAAQQERVAAVRAEYQSLLAQYESAPEAYFSDQSRQLDANQARLREISAMLSDARADLAQALDARERLRAERQGNADRLRVLRAQRAAQAASAAGATENL